MSINAKQNWGTLSLRSDLTIKDACVIVDQRIEDPMSDMVGRVSRWMVDTREAQIREGLIQLGWTPPSTT